ncbi:magnesium-transporting ATPase (P-type) [Salibacterium salarium]|uniref:hypothetical protein n=1 Tax=Salibacterium salarium TaxID=284579 RepID=UPI0027889643|nr:hypothetical protein [Salibacterium salarium]MDQ0297691.1 magnesium-transporting ATPase (P-type) [Salibacterium salarium]
MRIWNIVSVIVAGMVTVYGFLLTSIVMLPGSGGGAWIVIVITSVILVLWFWILYRFYKQNHGRHMVWMTSLLLTIPACLYAVEIALILTNSSHDIWDWLI